jgi:hypothetical protein
MNKHFICHKDDKRRELIRGNAMMFLRQLPLTDSIEIIIRLYEEPRTLPQNSFSHAIYTDIARKNNDDTPEGIKCYCKLTFGLPILAASNNTDVASRYSMLLETLEPLSYEYQLRLMRSIPVTSVMTKHQKSEYTEQVLNHYSAAA